MNNKGLARVQAWGGPQDVQWDLYLMGRNSCRRRASSPGVSALVVVTCDWYAKADAMKKSRHGPLKNVKEQERGNVLNKKDERGEKESGNM
jgi:hypothetical protein